MASGAGKKMILLVVWLVLLGGLIFWIKTAGSPSESTASNPSSESKLPKMDPAVLEAQWPQIVAAAAAPPRGSASARYTLAEFGDFQCPQCGKARPQLEALLQQYPSQVNLIFVHRPIPEMHKWALPASLLSEIAASHGKFWPMYDILYSHQDNLEPGFYTDYATQAGLDSKQSQVAFSAGQGMDRVQNATKLADSLNVVMTPTILVRDNATKTVTAYVGMSSKKNVETNIPYPGLDQLISRLPWK